MFLKSALHHLNLRSTRLLPRLNRLTKFILVFTIITGSIFLTKNILAIKLDLPSESYGNTGSNIDTTEFTKKYLEKQNAIDNGNNQEAWIEESLVSNTVSMNKALSGTLDEKTFNSTSGWIPGGMIGATNHLIANLYNPPASGVQYIAQSVNSFMGKSVYAANGFGFDQLNGVLTLWKTLRNSVYSLISIFFIILGIMIMLRIKISPQATITLQSIIPKIIITLILVTFSYAIAGLIIDLSYVVEGLILSIVMDNDTKSIANTMQLNYKGIYNIIYNKILTFQISTKLGSLIGSSIGGTMGGLTGWIGRTLGILAGALIYLFMALYTFILFIKLFFGLAKCYVNIIIKIIIAPFEIALGVFPNSKTGFSSWIFNLIANISVFPAVTIFIVVAGWLVPTLSTDNNTLWSPTLLGSGQVIGGLIGMVSILMLSKIPTIVPEAIFKIKPSPYGKDLFGGVSKIGIGATKGAGTLIASKSQDVVETAKKSGKKANFRWRALDKVTDVTSTLGWTRKKS